MDNQGGGCHTLLFSFHGRMRHTRDKPWMGRALHWYDNPVVIATHVLTLQEYGLYINAQGALTVENVVPFDQIHGVWVYRNITMSLVHVKDMHGSGLSQESQNRAVMLSRSTVWVILLFDLTRNGVQ